MAALSNFKKVTRFALSAYRVGELSDDQITAVLVSLCEEQMNSGTVKLPGEVDFPFWFALWEEHEKKPPEEKQKLEHILPGTLPLPIEVMEGRGNRVIQPEGTYREELVDGAEARSAFLKDLAQAVVAVPLVVKRRFLSYRLGKTLIYVEDATTGEHFTTDLHWDEYARLRKSVPPKVLIFEQAHELVQAMVDRGVLA